jgi:citrate lyase subunit beta/citryl-CoA lyase
MTLRPARSILFVPGDSERKIAKSDESGADAIILDLEDSVHPGAKDTARSITRDALDTDRSPRTFVRVNSIESGLIEADLDMLADGPPEAILLPKCASLDDICAVDQMLSDRGIGRDTTSLLPVATESARAVRNLMRNDWSHPRLLGLTWGAEDILADIGAFTNRENGAYTGVFCLARDLCLLASREAEVLAFDTAFVDVRDLEGCQAEAARSFRAGFDGKLAIHPAQVAVINDAFTPTSEQVEWARNVMQALEASGEGVALLDGRMIDMPHQRSATKILRVIEASAGATAP